MSLFDREDSQDQRERTINYLLTVVRKADEAKLKRLMEPTKFAIEIVFNHLIQDIEIASRNENGPGPLSQDDKYWIERLKFHKEVSGRTHENQLSKLLGYSVEDIQEFQTNQRIVERPANYDKIEPGPCPPQIKKQINKEMQIAWQRHIQRPLSDQVLQAINEKCEAEIKEIEMEARKNFEEMKASMAEIKVVIGDLISHKVFKKSSLMPY